MLGVKNRLTHVGRRVNNEERVLRSVDRGPESGENEIAKTDFPMLESSETGKETLINWEIIWGYCKDNMFTHLPTCVSLFLVLNKEKYRQRENQFKFNLHHIHVADT